MAGEGGTAPHGHEGFAIGVDLGTSNTVAVIRWPDGRTRPLLVGGVPVMPSAVYLDESGRLHVGRDAYRMAQLDPARFEPNPKRRIDEAAVLLADREVPVVDLLAAVLAAVARAAVEAVGFLPPAVVTYPAAWGHPRREKLVAAIARAGWPPVRLVPEPVAAARYFADVLRRPVPVGSCLAVFDFGGGTFDVAVVRNEGQGFAVLGCGGIENLGGLDIDAALVEQLGSVLAQTMPDAWRALRQPVTAVDRRGRRLFWDDVRGAKEMLSRTSAAPVSVPGVEQAVHLTRDELERVAEPLLRRTVYETASVINRCGLRADQLAGLFLVGGSSRLPLVARLLHTELGIAPTVLEQPELPVAEGALAEIVPPPQSAAYASAPASFAPAQAGPPAPVVPSAGVPAAPVAPAVPSASDYATTGVPVSSGAPVSPPYSTTSTTYASASAPPVSGPPVSGASVSGPPVSGPVSGPPVSGPPGSPPHAPVFAPYPMQAPPPPGQPGQPGQAAVPARRPWYARRVTWIVAVAGVLVLAMVAAGYLWLGRDSAKPVDFQTMRAVKRISMNAPPNAVQYTSTAVLGDRAYLAYEHDRKLEVVAAELATGKEIWRRQAPGDSERWAKIRALPGLVLALAQESSDSQSRRMYALDANTGKELWHRDVFGQDRLIAYEGMLVLESDNDAVVRGLDPLTGEQKWELRDPKDSYGNDIKTTVFGVDTDADLIAAAGLNGQPVVSNLGDDFRLLQLTSDKQLNVINVKTGHVDRTRANVALNSDFHWAYGSRLYTSTNDKGYRVQMYDLDHLGEPKVVYTSPNDRTLHALAPCGDGSICVLDTAGYDAKTTEIAAIDTAGSTQQWRKPAAGADQLVPVGPRVLATKVDSTPASHLFGPNGAQLLSNESENDAGVRVNGMSLILFSKPASDYPDDVSLSGVSAQPRTPTSLGLLQKIRTQSCAWNEAYLVCASTNDFGIWRFAK